MINKEDGSITIINDKGNYIKVYLLFGFEVESLHKKYIAYTSNANSDSDTVNVLISEIDYETNKIKSIPVNEMKTVMQMYNEVKKSLLSD